MNLIIKIISLFIFLILFGLNSIGQRKIDTAKDSVYRVTIAPKLTDLQTYGSFTTNYTSFSEPYASLFLDLFSKDAIIYNPFTKNSTSTESYIQYVKNNFPQGFYFEIGRIEQVRYSENTSGQLSKFTIASTFKINAYNYDSKKEEISVPVEIELSYDKRLKQSVLTGIRKFQELPIEKIQIQLIDPTKPDKKLDKILVELVLHDSIFQKSYSNHNGLVTFVGLPARNQFQARIAKSENLITKKLSIDCQSPEFLPNSVFYLPVFRSRETKLEMTVSGTTHYVMYDFSNPTLQDTYNLSNVNGDGARMSFSTGFRYGFAEILGFNLIGEIQIQFSRTNLRLEKGKFYHQFQTYDNANDSVLFKVNVNNFLYSGELYEISFPLALNIQRSFNNIYVENLGIGLGLRIAFPMIFSYTQSANYQLLEIYDKIDIIRRNLSEYYNKTSGFENATEVYISPTASVYGTFKIPQIGAKLLLRFLFDYGNMNLSGGKYFDVVTDDDMKVFNPLHSFVSKQQYFSMGFEFGIVLPLTNN